MSQLRTHKHTCLLKIPNPPSTRTGALPSRFPVGRVPPLGIPPRQVRAEEDATPKVIIIAQKKRKRGTRGARPFAVAKPNGPTLPFRARAARAAGKGGCGGCLKLCLCVIHWNISRVGMLWQKKCVVVRNVQVVTNVLFSVLTRENVDVLPIVYLSRRQIGFTL